MKVSIDAKTGFLFVSEKKPGFLVPMQEDLTDSLVYAWELKGRDTPTSSTDTRAIAPPRYRVMIQLQLYLIAPYD